MTNIALMEIVVNYNKFQINYIKMEINVLHNVIISLFLMKKMDIISVKMDVKMYLKL